MSRRWIKLELLLEPEELHGHPGGCAQSLRAGGERHRHRLELRDEELAGRPQSAASHNHTAASHDHSAEAISPMISPRPRISRKSAPGQGASGATKAVFMRSTVRFSRSRDLATQLAQLVALLRRQAVAVLAAIELILLELDPKRLRADSELARDPTHRPAQNVAGRWLGSARRLVVSDAQEGRRPRSLGAGLVEDRSDRGGDHPLRAPPRRARADSPHRHEPSP